MKYKLISFYSDPDPKKYYSKHAKRFVKECKKYGFDYYVEEVPNKGDYFKNSRFKPTFILKCLEKFKMPVIWVDIDSYIKEKPDLSELKDIDFAAVQRKPNGKVSHTIFAHVLFFNNTNMSVKLLRRWVSAANNKAFDAQFVGTGDHELLVPMYESWKEHRVFKSKVIEDFTEYTIALPEEVPSKVRIDNNLWKGSGTKFNVAKRNRNFW